MNLIESNGGLPSDSVGYSLLAKTELAMEGVEYRTVDVIKFMQKFTLDVLGKCVFSFDFGVLQRDEGTYVRLYNSVIRDLFNPLRFIVPRFDHLPLAMNERLERNMTSFTDVLQSVIQQRRESLRKNGGMLPDDRQQDLLDMMLGNGDETEGMTDEELRHNMNTFFLAGYVPI